MLKQRKKLFHATIQELKSVTLVFACRRGTNSTVGVEPPPTLKEYSSVLIGALLGNKLSKLTNSPFLMLFITACGSGGIANCDDWLIFDWADSAAGWIMVVGGAGTVRGVAGTVVILGDATPLLTGDRNNFCTSSRTIAAKSREPESGIGVRGIELDVDCNNGTGSGTTGGSSNSTSGITIGGPEVVTGGW